MLSMSNFWEIFSLEDQTWFLKLKRHNRQSWDFKCQSCERCVLKTSDLNSNDWGPTNNQTWVSHLIKVWKLGTVVGVKIMDFQLYNLGIVSGMKWSVIRQPARDGMMKSVCDFHNLFDQSLGQSCFFNNISKIHTI